MRIRRKARAGSRLCWNRPVFQTGRKKLGNLRLAISQGGIDCYRRRHFFEQKTKSLQDSFEAGRILAHIFVAAEELWLRLEVISDMEKNRRGERDEYLLTIQEKETARGEQEVNVWLIRPQRQRQKSI